MPQDLHSRLINFSPRNHGQRRIREFMLANTKTLQRLSLDDIALETQTSQPTVTRLVRRLGYENSLELRAAAGLQDMSGRLSLEQIRLAADVVRNAQKLFVFLPPTLEKATQNILNRLSAADVCSILPQIIYPGEGLDDFEQDSALLILALSEPPQRYDLANISERASAGRAKIIVLQAKHFDMPEIQDRATQRTFSLVLDDHVPNSVCSIYLLSAVADILLYALKNRAD